jgi:uncharacterized repeat protein (TIGR03803 family)
MHNKLLNTGPFLSIIALFVLMLVHAVTAQSFTTLHSFPAYTGNNNTNTDGTSPEAGLALSGNTLYGTAASSGAFGNGTIFAITTDGSGFTNLHSFTALSIYGTNGDGAYPYGGLVSSGEAIYGTAYLGGSGGQGTIFKINSDGTGFTNLYDFPPTLGPYPATNSSGANPRTDLLLNGNKLYGTATGGGTGGSGTVFALNTDGSGFTNLHQFTVTITPNPATNSDGAFPRCPLILQENILYGNTSAGGRFGNGVIFGVNTDGTGFTNLHNFTARDSLYGTNSDGVSPDGRIVLSGGQLFGTAQYGGRFDKGTIFTLYTDGSGFTNLHSFNSTNGSSLYSGLISSANTLYGTATGGGISGYGTAFKLNTDGTRFSLLHGFSSLRGPFGNTNSDGVEPFGGLILSSNILYGTTIYGGYFGYGTIFSISLPLPPELTISRLGTNVLLTWSTNSPGFTLQSATNLISSATWSAATPAPVIIGTNYTITNNISGAAKFYRLTD